MAASFRLLAGALLLAALPAQAGDYVAIPAGTFVSVYAAEPVDAGGPVSCGIPGHDRPGQELRASLLRVEDAPLRWEVSGRCGFASDFDYRSD